MVVVAAATVSVGASKSHTCMHACMCGIQYIDSRTQVGGTTASQKARHTHAYIHIHTCVCTYVCAYIYINIHGTHAPPPVVAGRLEPDLHVLAEECVLLLHGVRGADGLGDEAGGVVERIQKGGWGWMEEWMDMG